MALLEIEDLRVAFPGPVNPPSGGRFRTRCWQATDACATVQPPLTGDDHPVARHYPLAA